MNKSHQYDDNVDSSDVSSSNHLSNNKIYQKSPEKISEVIDSLQNKINELNTVIDHLKTTVSTMQFDIHNLQSVQMQYLIQNLKMETNLNYLLGQSDYLKHSTHPLYIQQSQEQYQTNQYAQGSHAYQANQCVQGPHAYQYQYVGYPTYHTPSPIVVNDQKR